MWHEPFIGQGNSNVFKSRPLVTNDHALRGHNFKSVYVAKILEILSIITAS